MDEAGEAVLHTSDGVDSTAADDAAVDEAAAAVDDDDDVMDEDDEVSPFDGDDDVILDITALVRRAALKGLSSLTDEVDDTSPSTPLTPEPSKPDGHAANSESEGVANTDAEGSSESDDASDDKPPVGLMTAQCRSLRFTSSFGYRPHYQDSMGDNEEVSGPLPLPSLMHSLHIIAQDAETDEAYEDTFSDDWWDRDESKVC